MAKEKFKNLPLNRGEYTPQGLKVGGLVEPFTINDSTWTKIVTVPYIIDGKQINAVNIQNQSGNTIKLNYVDKGDLSWEGILIQAGGERNYTIQPNVDLEIWAKGEPTTGNSAIIVEKIA